LEVFEQAEEGSEYVITRYRDANANLRTQLQRIIKRAGVKAWPKLFHNLRSTRQTELAEKYPIHVVCAWLGNSRAVAQDHYLQVTDAHFQHAAAEPKPQQVQAAQNAAQQPAEPARTCSQPPQAEKQDRPVLPGDSAPCDYLHNSQVTPTGSEHPSSFTGKTAPPRARGAKSGAPAGDSASDSATTDASLREVVTAWASLPQAVRAGILAMVRATQS
jgi:hypothetical protein